MIVMVIIMTLKPELFGISLVDVTDVLLSAGAMYVFDRRRAVRGHDLVGEKVGPLGPWGLGALANLKRLCLPQLRHDLGDGRHNFQSPKNGSNVIN